MHETKSEWANFGASLQSQTARLGDTVAPFHDAGRPHEHLVVPGPLDPGRETKGASETPTSASDKKKIAIPRACLHETNAYHRKQLCAYAGAIVDYAIDRANQVAAPQSELDESATDHLRFMKQWILMHYARFHLSGRGAANGLSFGALLWYSWVWLQSVTKNSRQQNSEQKERPLFLRANLVETLPQLAARMYRLCLGAHATETTTLLDWMATLKEAEENMIRRTTVSTTTKMDAERSLLVETMARTFYWTHLQFHYWAKLEQKSQSLLSLHTMPVFATILAACQTKRKKFLEQQISDAFDTAFSDFVYQHWLCCSLVEHFWRTFKVRGLRPLLDPRRSPLPRRGE